MHHSYSNVIFAIDADHSNRLIADPLRSRLLHQRLNLRAVDIRRCPARHVWRDGGRMLRLRSKSSGKCQRESQRSKTEHRFLHSAPLNKAIPRIRCEDYLAEAGHTTPWSFFVTGSMPL